MKIDLRNYIAPYHHWGQLSVWYVSLYL